MDSNGQIYPENKIKPELTVIDGDLSLPKFKLGGKDGGDGLWIFKIDLQQWFLCRPKHTNQIGLLTYQLVGFSPEKKAAYLFAAGEHMWVGVERFCTSHELIEVFPNGKDERDRPDNTG